MSDIYEVQARRREFGAAQMGGPPIDVTGFVLAVSTEGEHATRADLLALAT